MHGEIFAFSGDALGSVSNLALLIIASLVMALLVRVGISIFAMDRVKERKQATPQPVVVVRTRPLGVAQPQSRAGSKGGLSTELLSTRVMRYLDEVEVCNPASKSERAEHIIRSQRDTAAEEFRAARMERIRQSGGNA